MNPNRFLLFIFFFWFSSTQAQTLNQFYTVIKDPRTCPSPACGGFFLQQLGTTNPPIYVPTFNLSISNVTNLLAFEEADSLDLIVYGAVETNTVFSPFTVISAWRALPSQPLLPPLRNLQYMMIRRNVPAGFCMRQHRQLRRERVAALRRILHEQSKETETQEANREEEGDESQLHQHERRLQPKPKPKHPFSSPRHLASKHRASLLYEEEHTPTPSVSPPTRTGHLQLATRPQINGTPCYQYAANPLGPFVAFNMTEIFSTPDTPTTTPTTTTTDNVTTTQYSQVLFKQVQVKKPVGVDIDWLNYQTVNGSISLGRFVGTNETFVIQKTYIPLTQPECPAVEFPPCLMPTFTRNSQTRCVQWDDCTKSIACRQLPPTCAQGYTLVSIPSFILHGCSKFYCDPTYLCGDECHFLL